MNKIKMKFNDFVFETDPLYIEVIASRDVKVNSIYGKNSIANDICQEPIIVKGKGVLYGDDAQAKCNMMSKLLRQGLQGELHCPSLYPIKAIFTLFKYNANAQKAVLNMNLNSLRYAVKTCKIYRLIILMPA